jgi:hypothetical protein
VTGLAVDLPRVVEMEIHKNRVISGQKIRQVGIDLPGQHTGDATADANDPDVRNGSQGCQNPIELLQRQEKRIAAGEKNILDGLVPGNVAEPCLKIFFRQGDGVFPPSFACAEAAVHGAVVSHQPQYAIGIAVYEIEDRGKSLFGQGVFVTVSIPEFTGIRKHLAANGIARMLHEASVVTGGTKRVHFQ